VLNTTLPLHRATDPASASQPAPQAETTQPLLLDGIEAARLLGISPRTLWQLEKDGAIRSKRIGRRVLYARSVLEDFARR
jgi:excisionase family DNA binding protein